MAAADLVVAMGGYNTTAEILSVGTRALLVPRSGPSAEQTMRVSRFAERGWLRWLAPELLSPQSLANSMIEALSSAPDSVSGPPDLGGRVRAAELLHEQVDEYAVVPASTGG
jgi:predicted glycosyltransferase